MKKVKLISKIERSERAVPIVTVCKVDKTIGYAIIITSVSINLSRGAIPTTQYYRFVEGASFDKLYLFHACQQLHLDEYSGEYLTIDTHKVIVTT